MKITTRIRQIIREIEDSADIIELKNIPQENKNLAIDRLINALDWLTRC